MENTFSKDSKPSDRYIVFFDLDRTITKEISGRALINGAIKKGLMSASDLIYALYLSIVYKLNLRDPIKIINDMVIWVKGIPEKRLLDLCNEVYNEVLLPSVYDEARSEIKFHKERNAKIVILSSALTPICREIANNLELDDILCSDLEIKEGYLTGYPIGQLCFGNEKMVRLKEYCEKNNFNTAEGWYYGDSVSDLPALSAVGHPVCINPDNKLKRIAKKRGWKINNWHN
jgi:HAD superfamily hydrolase (TIGR01490 family)